MTVVLIVCSYNDQEFVRVGYYVNNEYEDPEMKENPPEKPELDKVIRNILSEKPRVTRVPIKWDNVDENPPPKVDEDAENDDLFDDDDDGVEDEMNGEAMESTNQNVFSAPQSQHLSEMMEV